LIDDDSLVNRIHTIHFSNMGLEDKVQSFTNPEIALEKLDNKDGFNGKILILLDINMPEMSGFEFLEHMVTNNFSDSFEVIIVTSSESQADWERAKKYGKYVKDFISKPLNSAYLMNYL
jgi:CheY-like chemotaxis protein